MAWENSQARAVCDACFGGDVAAMADHARRKLSGQPVRNLGISFRRIVLGQNRTQWWTRALRQIEAHVGEGKPVKTGKGTTYDFPVLVERDEDGMYVGTVPNLRGCHTQARTLDQLQERIVEAIRLCLETGQAPSPDSIVGFHQVRVTV